MYPWFVPLQIVKDFTSINPSVIDNNVWVTCLDVKEGENIAFYAGDSEGSTLEFKAPDDWRTAKDCVFELKKKNQSLHRIGIVQVLIIVQANFIFTISFDQQLKGFDATNGTEFFCLKNPNKCIYTSIFWDSTYQELFIADEKGFLTVLNVYMEKPLVHKKIINAEDPAKKKQVATDEKILKIEILEKTRSLLVHTDFGIKVFQIKRGTKQADMQGHKGPILKIISLEPQRLEKITRERIPDDPKIITCSLDNTIRLWDAKDMHVTAVMESPENAEISCMTFLTNCCLVATGHEDGSIRLWNMEINSSVTLKCEEVHRHKNSISCILGAYHKDSEFLMCGSYDGKVSIWEISEKKSTNSNAMLSSTIFPQLKMVIDNTKIPEKGDRRMAMPFGHTYEEEKDRFAGSEVLCLQFYADPEDPTDEEQRGHGYVVVGGSDKKVNIWNIRTYDHVAQFSGHQDSITSMAIDANILFTGSDDHSIGIWEL